MKCLNVTNTETEADLNERITYVDYIRFVFIHLLNHLESSRWENTQ